LNACQLVVLIKIGYLQPWGAVAVGPRRESAPTYHPRIKFALIEKEMTCGIVEKRVLKEAEVFLGIKGILFFLLCRWLVFCENDVVFACKPLTGVNEAFSQITHHKADSVAMGATHEATVGVVSSVERQTGMMVGMKWAQALVATHS
jgi:hypothetical protein